MKIVKELSFESFANYRGQIAVENYNMLMTITIGSVKLTDLTNAGKRGKLVPTISFCYKNRMDDILFFELLQDHGYNLRAIFDRSLGDVEITNDWSVELANNEVLTSYLSTEIGVRVKSPFIKSKFAGVKPKVSNKIEVGAIMYESWGYEQTNIDFYCVVQVKNNFVTLLPMSSDMKKGEVSFMTNAVGAGKIDFLGKELRREVKDYGSSVGFSIRHGWCSLWDGEPVLESHYA